MIHLKWIYLYDTKTKSYSLFVRVFWWEGQGRLWVVVGQVGLEEGSIKGCLWRKMEKKEQALKAQVLKGLCICIWLLALSSWRRAGGSNWFWDVGGSLFTKHFDWLKFTWEVWVGNYLNHVNSSFRFIKVYAVRVVMSFLPAFPLF